MMAEILQGQFLISARELRDSNFYRTVVLMLDHNDEGAMGLVINKPSAVTVESALSQQMEIGACQTPVFVGGPVETSALFILHNCEALRSHDQEIVPGLFLAGSHDSFESVVRDGMKQDTGVRFRVLCGYAGWGATQLEGELNRGDWRVMPADASVVLDEDPYGIWEVCTRRFQRASRIIPHNVRNPEWN